MIELRKITMARLMMLEPVLEQESRDALMLVSKPRSVCGKLLPDDLNGISIGELFALQDAVKSENTATIVSECARVVLGIAPQKVLRSRADEVLGFMLWVLRELERIALLWKASTPPPSAEAIQAGVDMLDFGEFGTIDWFAQRMHIQDHDKVMDIPWVRIYKCLDIDNKRAQFQERYREIINKQQSKKI